MILCLVINPLKPEFMARQSQISHKINLYPKKKLRLANLKWDKDRSQNKPKRDHSKPIDWRNLPEGHGVSRQGFRREHVRPSPS